MSNVSLAGWAAVLVIRRAAGAQTCWLTLPSLVVSQAGGGFALVQGEFAELQLDRLPSCSSQAWCACAAGAARMARVSSSFFITVPWWMDAKAHDAATVIRIIRIKQISSGARMQKSSRRGSFPRAIRDAYLTVAAASSISFATWSGCDVITTCEAPSTTTVFLAFARLAMKAWASAGMFLSALP